MARLQTRFYRFLLEIASDIYIILLAYFWILKDMKNLSRSEATLFYSAGFVVIACWLLLRNIAGLKNYRKEINSWRIKHKIF